MLATLVGFSGLVLKGPAAMPSTAGTACHRSDAGGAQSSVQRFREDSTAWASATPWRPPADAAVTLSLAGVSSLLRCPQPRPVRDRVRVRVRVRVRARLTLTRLS